MTINVTKNICQFIRSITLKKHNIKTFLVIELTKDVGRRTTEKVPPIPYTQLKFTGKAKSKSNWIKSIDEILTGRPPFIVV